jgi:hypothetical protein
MISVVYRDQGAYWSRGDTAVYASAQDSVLEPYLRLLGPLDAK